MIVHLSSCCSLKIDVFRVLAMVHILIRIHWPLTEIHPQSTARSTIKKITTSKFSEEKRESNRRSKNWTIKHGQQDSIQAARLVSLSYNLGRAVWTSAMHGTTHQRGNPETEYELLPLRLQTSSNKNPLQDWRTMMHAILNKYYEISMINKMQTCKKRHDMTWNLKKS